MFEYLKPHRDSSSGEHDLAVAGDVIWTKIGDKLKRHVFGLKPPTVHVLDVLLQQNIRKIGQVKPAIW